MSITRTEYVLYGVITVTGVLLLITIAMLWLGTERGQSDLSAGADPTEPVRFSTLDGRDEAAYYGTDLRMQIFSGVDPSAYAIDPPPRSRLESDLAVLRERESERTSELLTQAQREYRNVYFMRLPSGEDLQARLDASAANLTKQGFAELLQELEEYGLRLKSTADAPHVSQLDPELPAFVTPYRPGYPSLPTMRAELVALVMADLDPERASEYAAAAAALADRFEVAGVVYPAANAAATQYAQVFYDVISEHRAYSLLRTSAQPEWSTQ